ncbi:MAG: hypothetical protein JWP87_3924 [Labilithrix sp.]|nr:hypothetical protein [Labilithrix sp.]
MRRQYLVFLFAILASCGGQIAEPPDAPAGVAGAAVPAANAAPAGPETVISEVLAPRDLAIVGVRVFVLSGGENLTATYARTDGSDAHVVPLEGFRREWLGTHDSLVTAKNGRIEARFVGPDGLSSPPLFTLSVESPEVVEGPLDVAGVAADDTHLYWASATLGVLRAAWHAPVPSADDVPEVVIAASTRPEAVGPSAVTVDAANVYAITGYTMSVTSKDRLTTTTLADLSTPDDFNVDHTLLAVTNDAAAVYLLEPEMIRRVDKATGAVSTFHRFTGVELPAAFAIDGADLYVTVTVPNRPTGGKVVRFPLSGGEPATVEGNLRDPYGIATDAGFVYWTSRSYGTTAGAVTRRALRR